MKFFYIRFGRKGLAINFVTQEDYQTLKEIEKYYNTQIDEMPVSLFNLRLFILFA